MFGKKNVQQYTDEQLISKIVTGDHPAFNEIYKRYNTRLLYYFYRMLGNSNEKAQDFLQDIFIKLIDKAHTFDNSRKFSTWIFSIAYNMCKNEYRSMGIRKNTSIPENFDIINLDDTITAFDEVLLDPVEFAADLFKELENFDEIHKTVFLLHYREGFSLKEIGITLDISEGTVKSRLFYTRKRLMEKLVKYQSCLTK